MQQFRQPLSLSGFCGLALLFAATNSLQAADNPRAAVQTPGDTQTKLVEISRDDCRRLTRHVADADVAYQPGIDAQGRPVAPADLNPADLHSEGQGYVSRLETPTRIAIPIEVDLFDRFAVPANPDLFAADAQVGTVVYDDGKLYYNGQRLADGASDQVLLRCQELAKEGAISVR